MRFFEKPRYLNQPGMPFQSKPTMCVFSKQAITGPTVEREDKSMKFARFVLTALVVIVSTIPIFAQEKMAGGEVHYKEPAPPSISPTAPWPPRLPKLGTQPFPDPQ